MINLVRLYRSFKFAFSGLISLIRKEQNFRVHLISSVAIIFVGLYFEIKVWQWCLVILMIAIVLILEIFFIVFGISWDLGKYLNLEYSYVGGQYVPLGDIKILAPVLLAVFSTVLFLRTAGPYTKWLSVIIFASAFIIIYVMSPDMFRELLRSSIQRIFWYF